MHLALVKMTPTLPFALTCTYLFDFFLCAGWEIGKTYVNPEEALIMSGTLYVM